MESKLAKRTKICEYCRNSFTPYNNRNNQKFCKRVCKDAGYYQANKERIAERNKKYREFHSRSKGTT